MPTQRVPRQPELGPIRSVRYRRLPVPDVSTGGGAAVVRWGPNFGTAGGDSLPQKSTLALTDVQEAANLTQVQALGGALRADYTSGPGQVQALAGMIGPSYSGPNQVQTIRHTQLALSGALAQVQAVRHSSLALSGALAQVHALGGKARGAPNWQSVGTKALATALGNTQIVCPKPSGLQVGDLMLAWIARSTTTDGDLNVPAGWTGLTDRNPGSTAHARPFWKVADAADVAATDFTFTFTNTTLRATAEIHRIGGVDPTTPINIEGGGTASVIDPIVPSVTTTVVNCLVFAFLAHFHAASQAHAPPANHLERAEFQDTNVSLLSSSSYTRVFAAAGATGTATVDCDELTASAAAYARIAIAPGDVNF
jgi:hypothetical protein